MTHNRLYTAALKADDAFSAELERVYGKNRAGDARYLRNHKDKRVVAAKAAKLAADAALHNATT